MHRLICAFTVCICPKTWFCMAQPKWNGIYLLICKVSQWLPLSVDTVSSDSVRGQIKALIRLHGYTSWPGSSQSICAWDTFSPDAVHYNFDQNLILTHLCRVDSSTSSLWTGPFPVEDDWLENSCTCTCTPSPPPPPPYTHTHTHTETQVMSKSRSQVKVTDLEFTRNKLCNIRQAIMSGDRSCYYYHAL